MAYNNYNQEKIDKAIKNKEARYSKTELSILVSWAINNAVNSLSKVYKSSSWDEIKKLIKERYPFFINLHREWMLENLPLPEPPKVTRQDYAIAEREAPAKVAEANIALDTLAEEKYNEELSQRSGELPTLNI